jgi:hypothetical protein
MNVYREISPWMNLLSISGEIMFKSATDVDGTPNDALGLLTE